MSVSFAAVGLTPADAATPAGVGAAQAAVTRQLAERLDVLGGTGGVGGSGATPAPGPSVPGGAEGVGATPAPTTPGTGGTGGAGGVGAKPAPTTLAGNGGVGGVGGSGSTPAPGPSDPGGAGGVGATSAPTTSGLGGNGGSGGVGGVGATPAPTTLAGNGGTGGVGGSGSTSAPTTLAGNGGTGGVGGSGSTSAPTTTTPTTSTAPDASYNLSAAAKAFLAGLNISLGSGPVTGTLTGTTLTVTVGAPALPLTLPVGNDAISFGGATLTLDESTDTLTLSATATTADGVSGTLSVTIDHVSTTTLTGTQGSTDLSATVTLAALPVLGTTVDLAGTLAYTDGKVSASLTGTLDADTVIAPGAVTLDKGTTITLSTSDGATVSGTAEIGSGAAQFTVDIAGSISGKQDWSISVDTDTNAPSFTPVTGLTLTPAFSGSVTDKDGTIGFDVTADEPVSWSPRSDVTVAINHVEVSNQATPTGVACPAGIKDGDVWFDVQGGLTDSTQDISAAGEACIDPSAQAFTLTASATGAFGPADLGFMLSDPTLTIDGDLKAHTVDVSAAATLDLTGVAGAPAIPVTVDFSSDGSFTAAAGVDLGQLGLGTGTGTLLLSSKEIKDYTNATEQIADPIDLPAGVTVVLQEAPSQHLKQILTMLNLPVPQQIQALASLGPKGFSFTVDLDLGAGAGGVDLLPNVPGGFHVYLDTLQVQLGLNASAASITFGGTALLHIPALYSGSTASDVDLTLNGSLSVGTDANVKITAGFDLDAVNGAWTDAFGIPGLSIGELAANAAVEVQPEDLGIPLPALSFTVNDVVLPTQWADAIGEVPGAAVSATLDLDADNPILSFAISPGAGQTVALEPLRIANDFTSVAHAAPLPDSVVDTVQLQDASLLFAPAGGKDATGQIVSPGATLVFDAGIAGKTVHVDGSIGISPFPELIAHVSIPSFGIGPVNFGGTTLAIDLEANPAAPKVDFDFAGSFTDSFTGIQFAANIDLGASISLLNASVSLQIAGGQPSYISGGAQLQGAVHADGSGFSFSASGSAYAYVAGQYIGTIAFSYSTDSGAIFAQLQQLAGQAASWFRNVYGESDQAVASALNQVGVGANQIASALQSVYGDGDVAIGSVLNQINTSATQIATTLRAVFGDGDARVAAVLNQTGQAVSNTAYAVRVVFNEADSQVAAALNAAGLSPNQIASGLQAAFGDADWQVASALNQVGISPSQIASALQSAYGDSQAAVYNVLGEIGDGGQSVLDSIAGFFNTGSYWIYSNPWWSVPLYVDDSGGSFAPGNGIIQYTWTGGHNQDWYVLPTDSGYAEIVNRNSGQCLTEIGGAGAQVVQDPCYGWTTQQWNLGVYPGQNLNYTGHNVTNRWSGLDLDVYGASTSAGTGLDAYYGNGGWNQWFTFEPAIG